MRYTTAIGDATAMKLRTPTPPFPTAPLTWTCTRSRRRPLFPLINGRSLRSLEEGEPGEYRIVIGGEQYAVAVASERDARPSRTAQRPLPHSGEVLVKAPMPGLVVAVTVSVGDTVRAGQGLVQLEAMKMENELLAPAGGTVRAVHASKGQTVNVGQLLITIGP